MRHIMSRRSFLTASVAAPVALASPRARRRTAESGAIPAEVAAAFRQEGAEDFARWALAADGIDAPALPLPALLDRLRTLPEGEHLVLGRRRGRSSCWWECGSLFVEGGRRTFVGSIWSGEPEVELG